MKKTIVWLLFLSFVLVAILSLERCRDQYPVEFDHMNAEQIEGLWRGDQHPHWFYHFSDGVLHQSIYDFNVVIVEHWYGYTVNEDTIFLKNMVKEQEPRILTVYFESDSVCTLKESFGMLAAEYKLKRF